MGLLTKKVFLPFSSPAFYLNHHASKDLRVPLHIFKKKGGFQNEKYG